MKRGKTGEQWIVGINDDVNLKKVVVLDVKAKCVEVQELIEGQPKGPKLIIRNIDIEFVEKL